MSGVLVQRDFARRPSGGTQQQLDVAYCLRAEQHVTADGAHLCRNPVNDDDAAILADGVRHKFRFTIIRTSGNSALLSVLLWIGVVHLGGFGSCTVTSADHSVPIRSITPATGMSSHVHDCNHEYRVAT